MSRTSTATRGAAASRMVFWTKCDDVVGLTNAALDEWHDRGVGGFVCVIQHLADLGGDQNFSAESNASLSGTHYRLQRQMRASDIVKRAKARSIKLWLGFYLSNYNNQSTPLENWYDDAKWSNELLPRLADIAGAARTLGFAGLAFDEEMYDHATWDWDYPGNSHAQPQVRAEVRARGVQMMQTMVRAFPGVDIIDYGTYFPEDWNALVQQEINAKQPYGNSVQINLWDGLTSVPGYRAIRFFDATFYKTTHLSGATWDTALTYNANRLLAYLSRHLTNWAYAANRINVSPFAWIDGDVENEGAFTAPRPPPYVADQLAAFRRWGMGGMFGVYTYDGLASTFDYGPYTNGMKAAAQPGTVDSEPPKITIASVIRAGGSVTISGTATDNMGIRSVLWSAGGRHGAAQMTWSVTGGHYYSQYQWHTNWTAKIAEPPNESITVVADDIKNNTASADTSP